MPEPSKAFPLPLSRALPPDLIKAAARGEIKRVVKWLRQGHVDAQCSELTGNALLHSAAVHEHLPLMQELLKRGATVDLQNAEGSTALMAAAEQARFGDAAVRLLLDYKADANLQTNLHRVTALMSAARNGHHDVVALLLVRGADPDILSAEYGTALHQAAGAGNRGCVLTLLDAGANAGLRTQLGVTARDQALKAGYSDIAQILARRSSTPDSASEASKPSSKGAAKKKQDGVLSLPSPETQGVASRAGSARRKLLSQDLAKGC